MKNVKDKVYEALCKVTDNVSDAYPRDWESDTTIQYAEEDNKVCERTDNTEDKAYVRYKIDIWHRRSTSQAAIEVDKYVSALGLVRTLCTDVADPSNLKHKTMRYEGIIDMNSDYVYWNK